MAKQVDLLEIEQNARSAFSKDGLMYLFLGLMLAMVGLSFYDTRFSGFGGFAALLFFPVRYVRERITYPRVGYAEFVPPKGLWRGMLGFVVVVVAALSLIAFWGNGRFQQFMPIAISIVFGLSIYFGTSMVGTRWFDWVMIGLMLVGGVVSALLVEDWKMATAFQFWTIATLLIIVGTVTFIRFLQKYPVLSDVEPRE